MINFTYVVIETSNIIQSMVNESLCTATSFRKCNDGSYSILTFESSFPETMGGYLKYNHTEMMAYLETNSADWEATI